MHADACDVNVLVRHGHLAQVLLLCELATLGKLGHRSLGCCLGRLTARVAVHLRVKDEDVHVLLAGNHVVQATVPDVVGPAVSTNNPEAAAAEHVFQVVEVVDLWMRALLLLQKRHELLHDLMVDAAALRQQEVMHLLLAHHQELLQCLTKFVGHRHGLIRQGVLHLHCEVVAALLEGLAHAEAELGVVFEQGVGPGRTLSLVVRGVREGWVGATPDRGAACGIGNNKSIAEELRHQLHVRRLATALARPRELKVWFLKLGALDRRLVNFVAAIRQCHSEVPVGLLFLNDLLGRTQGKCIRGANAHAKLAASAVPRRHLNAVLVVVQNTSSDGRTTAFFERCRCFPKLLRSHQEWSHSCMGADQTALVALRALVHVYRRHLDCNATLLVLTGTTWHAATGHKGTHGKRVAIQIVARFLHLRGKLRGILHFREHAGPLGISDNAGFGVRSLRVDCQGCPSSWNFAFHDACY
mmetsp:Transcript_15838/g.37381  ORF Transcript_15838/g.37381 Transcript_15838/m.37381 type:complete len:470 (+) Transcript_15838:2359-3768(+)